EPLPHLRGAACRAGRGARLTAPGSAFLVRAGRPPDHPSRRADLRRARSAPPSGDETADHDGRHAGRTGARQRGFLGEAAVVPRQVLAQMTRAALPAVLAVILGCSIGAGCSSEDVAREAEARARRWDIPATRIMRDIVYAQYGPRQLKL